MTVAEGYIHPTLAKLKVAIDQLVPYGKNPRKGNVAAIQESLRHNGQFKPIVVRQGTWEILAGNHTYRAALELGWTEIAATFVDVDDDSAARIVLADNRTSDLAEYDNSALADLLKTVDDLEGTGFTEDDLQGLEPQSPADAPDEADDVPEDAEIITISKPGDVFHLGRHSVICGDSTETETYERLLGDEKVTCVWTDPPYGVEYVGKTKDALRIENDGSKGLRALLIDAFSTMVPFCRGGAPVYVAHTPAHVVTFNQSVADAGFDVRQQLVWVKNALVLSHLDYHPKHEPVLLAETPDIKENSPVLYGFAPGGAGRLGRGGARWYGGNDSTTVFEFPKPNRSAEHPTMKPVGLILAMLANSVKQNDPEQIILDAFGGSGSTLVAADAHGASARIIELDPRYVDVICARYQKLTGIVPKREDGTEVDFLKE